MMNVGEKRAQNGVLDCPESKNEEKFLSIDRMGSSRYAEVGLRVLRDAWKISKILSKSFVVREAQIGLPLRIKKSSSLELYLVNPCGAEQESLIVLLADNPFAGRIASPLGNSDDMVRMQITLL
ncbi:hypothetical protein E3N88_38720 [Mikania micrantha]|uniref:Uncharacterized protein n=1 Tax=Mikania micrantha TaxID=192012 RepID=A0A5N6LUT2_9ASTR|nr:hypothetical protein E3N88_38720 [Mikania micrantha]